MDIRVASMDYGLHVSSIVIYLCPTHTTTVRPVQANKRPRVHAAHASLREFIQLAAATVRLLDCLLACLSACLPALPCLPYLNRLSHPNRQLTGSRPPGQSHFLIPACSSNHPYTPILGCVPVLTAPILFVPLPRMIAM